MNVIFMLLASLGININNHFKEQRELVIKTFLRYFTLFYNLASKFAL